MPTAFSSKRQKLAAGSIVVGGSLISAIAGLVQGHSGWALIGGIFAIAVALATAWSVLAQVRKPWGRKRNRSGSDPHSQAELGSVSQQLPELLSVNILPLLALNGRYRAPPSKPILTITIPPFPIISSPESAVPAAPSGVEKGTIPFPEFAVPAAPGGVGNWLMVDDLRPSRPLTRRRPRPKSDPSLGAAYRDQSPAATLRRGAGVQENPDSHR